MKRIKLLIYKRLLRRYSKRLDSEFLNIVVIIKKMTRLTNYKQIEYIWYCPRASCRCILVKNNKPFLPEKQVFKCKRCNCRFGGVQLMKANKKNIRKFVEALDNCQPVDNLD